MVQITAWRQAIISTNDGEFTDGDWRIYALLGLSELSVAQRARSHWNFWIASDQENATRFQWWPKKDRR